VLGYRTRFQSANGLGVDASRCFISAATNGPDIGRKCLPRCVMLLGVLATLSRIFRFAVLVLQTTTTLILILGFQKCSPPGLVCDWLNNAATWSRPRREECFKQRLGVAAVAQTVFFISGY